MCEWVLSTASIFFEPSYLVMWDNPPFWNIWNIFSVLSNVPHILINKFLIIVMIRSVIFLAIFNSDFLLFFFSLIDQIVNRLIDIIIFRIYYMIKFSGSCDNYRTHVGAKTGVRITLSLIISFMHTLDSTPSCEHKLL